jgi:hypothetical protein
MSSPPRAPDNGLKGERVVTRIQVPGRHKPFHGACGKRVLRFTLRLAFVETKRRNSTSGPNPFARSSVLEGRTQPDDFFGCRPI